MLEDYPPTQDPYLDGRYFKAMLGDQPGVLKEPIVVRLGDDPSISIVRRWPSNVTSYARVIVETPTMRHSCLFSLDPRFKEAELWDPREDPYGDFSYEEGLRNLIEDNLLPADYELISEAVYFETDYPAKTHHRGYCNAFVLREAADRLTGNYPAGDIRRFCTYVKANYELPAGKPDIEYGPGFGLGLLTGALVGGALVAATRPRR